jgi:hypothetical protein
MSPEISSLKKAGPPYCDKCGGNHWEERCNGPWSEESPEERAKLKKEVADALARKRARHKAKGQ